MANMMVQSQPVQGALYHRLQAVVAANYAGLGPQNVANATYRPMIGRTFQKPLSGSATLLPNVIGNPYR